MSILNGLLYCGTFTLVCLWAYFSLRVAELAEERSLPGVIVFAFLVLMPIIFVLGSFSR